MRQSDMAVAGTKVMVNIFGQDVVATVQDNTQLWGAESARICA
jgi:hypothetical protein